ncbi:putative reverse transcriptase domain-containing protein [Tanacetum coccineum]
MKCPQHYLTEMQEVILFYNGLEVPTRQIFYSKGAIPTKTVADAKLAIQEMVEYSQKWHNGTSRAKSIETSNGLAAIQAQLNNLRREIKKVNEKYMVLKLDMNTKDCPLKEKGKKGSYGPKFLEANSYKALIIENFIPQKRKDPGSFTLHCYINNVCFDNALADLGTSVSVMPLSTYLNLGLGELAHTKLIVELRDRTVKYPKGIAKNVLVGIGKFVFLVDFIILDMPEDVKVPLILGRPFLSTACAKIDVFKRNITLRVGDEKIIFKCVKPASSLIKRVYMLCLRERMELDLEARLMGETFMLNRSLDPFFAVVENMDPYVDEGMGEVVVGKPFCEVSCVKTKRFDGIITIHGEDESVTYQMTQSHPRFKRHTNEQCNKIPPLLKVSEEDKMNGISHSYQKLKRFYKGVLNLGPNFIRDPSMEEWLTRGHVSVHELEW